MANSERRRQKKLEDKARRRKESAKMKPPADVPKTARFVEWRDSFEEAYRLAMSAAKAEHPTLLRVIECGTASAHK